MTIGGRGGPCGPVTYMYIYCDCETQSLWGCEPILFPHHCAQFLESWGLKWYVHPVVLSIVEPRATEIQEVKKASELGSLVYTCDWAWGPS